MPTTLDEIRSVGESKIDHALAVLEFKHRRMIREAIERYGFVPESTWQWIRRDIEENEEIAAALLLLFSDSDSWTAAEIERGGVSSGIFLKVDDYKRQAALRRAELATVQADSIRDRLIRNLDEAKRVGRGIGSAIDETVPESQRKTIAVDQTTRAITLGQRTAAKRIEQTIGGDGADTTSGQRVALELMWKTERDDRVCPRCSPLDGTYEAVWGRVFPNGPGPEAHPNCRCHLEPKVIVSSREVA